MSRAHRYKWSLLTSYGALGAQVVSALVTIPLALAYLTSEMFGVWMLVGQVTVFYQLVDVGFSEAFVRLLIDYKARGEESYRRGLKTAVLVMAAQGLLIVSASILIALALPRWLGLEPRYAQIFVDLVIAQACVFGISNILRVFNQALTAHQRADLVNISSIAGLLISLAVKWILLAAGNGVWSLWLGSAAMSLILAGMNFHFCRTRRLIDRKVFQAKFSKEQFLETFSYGKERFLATLGDRAMRVVPGFLITRHLGLEANALWGAGQRIVLLLEQILSKPVDMAYPFLAGMYVGNEADALERHYAQLLRIVAAVAGIFGCGIATGLPLVLDVWTGGELFLEPLVALAFAAWFIVAMIKRSLWPAVTIPKKMGWTKVTNVLDLGLMVVIMMWLPQRHVALWSFVVIAAVTTFGSSVPYMIARAVKFTASGSTAKILADQSMAVGGGICGLLGWFLLNATNPSSWVLQCVIVTFSTAMACAIAMVRSPELWSKFKWRNAGAPVAARQ